MQYRDSSGFCLGRWIPTEILHMSDVLELNIALVFILSLLRNKTLQVGVVAKNGHRYKQECHISYESNLHEYEFVAIDVHLPA